jgi:phosphinothricin acetyltransferase
MQNSLILRAARPKDLESILSIYNEIVMNTTATFEEEPRPLSEFQNSYNYKLEKGFPWFVAELNQQVIGYATYGDFRKASGYKVTVEHSLHVHPEFRGQGVGSRLLEMLIVSAKENSLSSMIAGIDSANTQSLLLHEKFGFQKVAELPRVARKFSRWLDLTFMQLQIEN